MPTRQQRSVAILRISKATNGAWSDTAGQASIESRQHHHAEMDRNAQIANKQVRTRYHHIAKWITGNPRATVFQYSKPNKVKATEDQELLIEEPTSAFRFN